MNGIMSLGITVLALVWFFTSHLYKIETPVPLFSAICIASLYQPCSLLSHSSDIQSKTWWESFCLPDVQQHQHQPYPRLRALWPSCLPCSLTATSMDTTLPKELDGQKQNQLPRPEWSWGKSEHDDCPAQPMGTQSAFGKPEKPAAHSFNEILTQLLPPHSFIRWDYWTLALVSCFHAARCLPCAPNTLTFCY